jgi:hypothetical protein
MPSKATAAPAIQSAAPAVKSSRGSSALAPSSAQFSPFTQLQQGFGNQAMQQLLETGAVQAKLRVSQPGDADEIEADRVAARVVRNAQTPIIQRKCSCSGASHCAACEEEELKGIHRKAISPLSIQRSDAATPFSLPAISDMGANLEADANFSAAKALYSAYASSKGALKSIGETAGPRLRSGLKLQRCAGAAQELKSPESAAPVKTPDKPAAAAPAARPPHVPMPAEQIARRYSKGFTDKKLSPDNVNRALRLFGSTPIANQVLAALAKKKIVVTAVFISNNNEMPNKERMASGTYRQTGAKTYDIYVMAGMESSQFVPVGDSGAKQLKHFTVDADPDSMADTLFHEMLHAWFENYVNDSEYGFQTGHNYEVKPTTIFGDSKTYDEPNYDERFLSKLKQFDRQVREVKKNDIDQGDAPSIQRKAAGTCNCAAPAKFAAEFLPRALSGSISNPVIQRAPATPNSTAARPDRPANLIVPDDATSLTHGQMKKSEFIAMLKGAVCSIADAALATTGKNTKGCPYIEKWLAFYSDQDSSHVERALVKYAPETARARSAREYIPIICNRVQRAVLNWAKTGEITGVPPELASQFMGAGGGFLGALQGFASSKVGSSVLGFLGGSGSRDSSPSGAVQRKPSDSSEPDGGDSAEHVRSQLGHGHSLNPTLQSQMSWAFGYDFSSVRVHTDAQAAWLSTNLSARAFTVGKDVAFASGEYKPGTPIGDALIAHELAHVVQQNNGQTFGVMTKGSAQYDRLEEDADLSAVGAIASLWSKSKATYGNFTQNAFPRLRSGLGLQRCGKDDHDFEIRGISDELDNRSIFFNQKSSDLDKSQEPKIPALKLPVAQDLTLHSFVSEDENAPPAAGLKLARERFETVSKELHKSPNKHVGNQTPDLDTTSSKGNSDYRKMRKVVVKPSGAPSGVANCAAGGEIACADPTKFTTAQTKASNLLLHAINRLTGPLLPPTRALLQDRFGAKPATLANIAKAVKANLTHLRDHINVQMNPLGTKKAPVKPGHRCANECEGCQPGTVAFNNGQDASALMTLCDNSSGGFMNEPDLVTRAATLIHEGLHGITLATVPVLLPPPATDGTTDFSYEDQRLIKFLDPSTALQNTDSYVLLVEQLNGLPVTVGRGVPDPATGVPLSPGVGGEREQVDRALGWLEGWLTWSEQEVSGIYESVNKALKRVPPKWAPGPPGYYEEAMAILAPIFGLTVPRAAPTDRDKFAVAAILDRYEKMQGVLFSTSSIAIKRESSGETSWARGPKQSLTLGPDFFAFPAGPGRDRKQLDLLLRKIIEAHPDISESARPKYFLLTDSLRKHFGGGSPG